MEHASIFVNHLALFTGTVFYESFIITLFFDLSLFHMQPGIIAGDEVKYDHGYDVTFLA